MMNFKHLFLTIFCAILIFTTQAQTDWTLSNNGIEEGYYIADFTTNDANTIYAVGNNFNTAKIYKSLNAGSTWVEIPNSGLSNHNYFYSSIISIGNYLLLSAGDNAGNYSVYKSSDNGATWVQSAIGLASGYRMTGFASNNTNILYGIANNLSAGKIYKTVNLGESWVEITTSGLENHSNIFNAIDIVNNLLFLSANNNSGNSSIYKSSDNGTSWVPSNNGIQTGYGISGFAFNNLNDIYAIANNLNLAKLYKSTNQGSSWFETVTSGLENHNNTLGAIELTNNHMFLSANDNSGNSAVYKSDYSMRLNQLSLPPINIYPNPAQNVINIETNQHFNIVNFFTLDGSLILSSFLVNQQVSISALPNGIYILRYNQFSKKIVIIN